jgi:hypothetical protein
MVAQPFMAWLATSQPRPPPRNSARSKASAALSYSLFSFTELEEQNGDMPSRIADFARGSEPVSSH